MEVCVPKDLKTQQVLLVSQPDNVRGNILEFCCKLPAYVFALSILLIINLFSGPIVQAQQIDLLLKGGHVIDAKNNIDSQMDVAVTDGKIVQIAKNISENNADKVIDVRGLYVTPGIVDIHGHHYHGTDPATGYSNGFNSLPPDGFTFKGGVTTVVDAGGAGWRNFRHFKEQVIDRSRTRVLAFINIVGNGMIGSAEQDLMDMNPRMTAIVANRYPEIIGVKIAHFDASDRAPGGSKWRETITRSVEAGTYADIPVMVDFGSGRPSIEELFMDLLRPGDIFTHTYHPGPWKEPVVDENGKVKPFVFDAQEKGIIFDVGHGGSSFAFSQVIPSIEQGFLPDVIATDLHTEGMNGGLFDMANLMSKFLNMGMSLQDVVLRTTWIPATVIKREDLGHLGVGAEADIAVFSLRNGDFGFVDGFNWKMNGTQLLETELTVRAGRIVWDRNGMSFPMWDTDSSLGSGGP